MSPDILTSAIPSMFTGVQWGLVFYVAVGTILCYAKMKHDQRRVYALTEVIEQLVGNHKLKVLLELFVFVLLGCVLSMGIIGPSTVPQAFAAGLAWTGLATGK